MTTPSDQSLKLSLANMLPELIGVSASDEIYWLNRSHRNITETELLHVCWLVEQGLNGAVFEQYRSFLVSVVYGESASRPARLESASWQARAIALAKVKGVEV